MGNHINELPEFFGALLREQYPAHEAERIVAGCAGRQAVTLRANTLKASRSEIAEALEQAGVEWEGTAWYEDAFVLKGTCERDLWELDAYREGKVYLQSLSSMIPALVLDARAGEDVCDMCAAPGGKTTQIAALSGGSAYITACEMHAPRAEKLEYNLAKLGARNVTVMRTDARKLDEFFSFDRILVDAPCSGSGTLVAGNPKTARRFTMQLIEKSVRSQRALLSKALALLKPGGTVVYSTCSVLSRENEDVVEWAFEHSPRGARFEIQPVNLRGRETLPLLASRIDGALCVCPTELYEGFFICKIKRTG